MHLKFCTLLAPVLLFTVVVSYLLIKRYVFGINKSLYKDDPRRMLTAFGLHLVGLAVTWYMYPGPHHLWAIRLLIGLYVIASFAIAFERERDKLALRVFVPFGLVFTGLIVWSFL